MFSHSKKLRRWIFIWMFLFLFFLSLQHALITTEWLTGLRWREEEVGHARQRVIKERERGAERNAQKKKGSKSEKYILQSLPRCGFSFGAQISTPTPLQKAWLCAIKKAESRLHRARSAQCVSACQTDTHLLLIHGRPGGGGVWGGVKTCLKISF